MSQFEFDEQLFWSRVAKGDICWEWQGNIQPKGYGMTSAIFEGKRRMVLAHRAAWFLAHGAIEHGIQIDHTCFNRACVRVDHLRLATAKQNNENRSGPQKNNRVGIRGVSKRGDRWRARVVHNSTYYNIGYYDSAVDAEAAVIAKRNELFTHNNLDRAAA